VTAQDAQSGTPFPGAHSQVTGMHPDGVAPTRTPGGLPLQSTPGVQELGWSIRLPVRAEQVVVEKQLVVRERVVVPRRELNDLAHVDARVRREELQVDLDDTAHLSPTPVPVDDVIGE
jgi:hypothetical protein